MKKNLWHSKTVDEVFNETSSHHEGISQKEAEKRLLKYGPNVIEDEKRVHPLFVFLKQFKSGLVYVLIAAAAISFLFHKIIDVYVILVVIFLNAGLGFVQEYKAEKAIQALKKMVVQFAKVYREGKLLEIAAEHLVVGDVVLLGEGARVPADVRLFYTKNFRTSEASLTGESVPVGKKTEVVIEEADLGDRKNMAFMGTFVAGGKAKGVVVATGSETFFGTIAKDIREVKKRGGHFEEKISILAKQMVVFAFGGASIILFFSLYTKGVTLEEIFSLSDVFQESLLFAVAALVSGIPEGLPATLVIVLAIGATRMAKKNAIIRRLPATETLGVADHIITDKTGTLTQNTMNVRKIILADNEEIDVTGEGWIPKGDFLENEEKISPLEKSNLEKLLHIAGVCNEAEIAREEEGDKYKIIGDPTEASLVVLAQKAGLSEEMIYEKEKKIDDMPFSSKLKYRASLSVLLNQGNKKQVYVVGAPEEVIEKVEFLQHRNGVRKITKEEKEEILKKVEGMTDQAMRTIGLAYKEVKDETEEIKKEDVSDLILTGVVGIMDPPRPEVKEAILKARKAGIRVMMVTGDHKGTALAISKEIGLLEEGDNRAFTQHELLEMSEDEFVKTISEVNVFARLTPHMKLRIAKTLQEKKGAIIAMTGDGVNDAPAVRQADIGIAMGIAGTDVTKEAGEIILADDNFASIVGAIEEGRIVFTNTRQASSFLITTNFAEFITLITSILLRFPLPLLPTQILWLNLVTDGAVGFPLAAEPGHGKVLNRPPRNKKENILSLEILPFFILMAVIMTIASLFVFNLIYQGGGGELDRARAAVFTVMAFTQLFNVLNMRSLRESVFSIGLFSNPSMILALFIATVLQVIAIEVTFFREIFGFGALKFSEFILFIGISSLVLVFGEAYKYLRYRLIGDK
jgi:P-type Ca2+ transporter type 2C